jgi:hypothetical protein
MTERGGDLLLGHVRPVVAINRQRDATVLLQVARPGQGAIEAVEFLEQESLSGPEPGGPLKTRYRMAKSSST